MCVLSVPVKNCLLCVRTCIKYYTLNGMVFFYLICLLLVYEIPCLDYLQ